MKNPNKSNTHTPQFLVVDLFCGAGGTSLGFDNAINSTGGKVAKVIACVNHDAGAIRSHAANFPECVHFQEDVRNMDFVRLSAICEAARAANPTAKLILWASLECTHFSNAKTGPRNADSRTLAYSLYDYVHSLSPDFVMIENVREFMSWGELCENGKPLHRKKGIHYVKWRETMEGFGYRYSSRLLNSADYGAYQSRLRYFAVFAKHGLPVVFPEPTHDKKARHGLLRWKAVRDVLDLEEVGDSIFARKKPLSDNTLRRILAGLIKFVANGDVNFIVKNYGGNPADKVVSIDQPGATITTVPHESLVTTDYFVQYNGKPEASIFPDSGPCNTLTTKDRFAHVRPAFIDNQYGCENQARGASSIDEPCGTLPTVPKKCLVWIDNRTLNGQPTSADQPSPTLVTCPTQSVVFLDRQFGASRCTSVEEPCGAILTEPKTNIVCCEPFLMPTQYGNEPKGLDVPHPVITANRKHTYLLNPQYYSAGGDVNQPCFTLIAKMDKRPPHVVTTEEGDPMRPWISIEDLNHPKFGQTEYFKDESVPVIQRIRAFMVLYRIRDIYMRMLFIPELKRIQGLEKRGGPEYILEGPKDQQKKFIGNAVVPDVVTHWIEAYGRELLGQNTNPVLHLVA